MSNKERISLYNNLVRLQDIKIKFLKKELSVYRDKYKKLRGKYYNEIRKNRVKN